MQSIGTVFIQSALERFRYYKALGDQTFAQLKDTDFHFSPNNESNSISVIIRHMTGNMLSRWTDFLTTDGEKEWRERDKEFQVHPASKEELLAQWEKGWTCCMDAIAELKETDLLKTITIRGKALTVTDAINGQLAHYPYHVGQMIFIAKMIRDKDFKCLSIPRSIDTA